jgi:hypothetical protein
LFGQIEGDGTGDDFAAGVVFSGLFLEAGFFEADFLGQLFLLLAEFLEAVGIRSGSGARAWRQKLRIAAGIRPKRGKRSAGGKRGGSGATRRGQLAKYGLPEVRRVGREVRTYTSLTRCVRMVGTPDLPARSIG